MIIMLQELKKDLQKLKNPKKAKLLSGFSKTGKGEYGEGDKFLGIMVPEQRKVAEKYRELRLSDLQKLLNTKIHEYRLTAIFILIYQFIRSVAKENFERQKKIYDFYLKNTKNINNWDLVDLSAPRIVGVYLLDKGSKDRKILYKLAHSKNLWNKRIAVLATMAFIKQNDFKDTLMISKILLHDQHDLIHKAVGWMLREVGKRDQNKEEEFLKKHIKTMPRTMLRYAIEKFPEKKRKAYLNR